MSWWNSYWNFAFTKLGYPDNRRRVEAMVGEAPQEMGSGMDRGRMIGGGMGIGM